MSRADTVAVIDRKLRDWFTIPPMMSEPLADGLVLALEEDQPDHYLTITPDDRWFIEHSMGCRLAGTLGSCQWNEFAANLEVRELPAARYLIIEAEEPWISRVEDEVVREAYEEATWD
jgi:hypothetical protein